jgi:hypothetical protein
MFQACFLSESGIPVWGFPVTPRTTCLRQMSQYGEIKRDNNVLEWHSEGRSNSRGREEKHGNKLEGRVHRVD